MSVPSEKDWHRLIDADPKAIRGMKAFIKGRDVSVQAVIDALADGASISEVRRRFSLSMREVRAAMSLWRAAIEPDGRL